jgi:hypothetical protein
MQAPNAELHLNVHGSNPPTQPRAFPDLQKAVARAPHLTRRLLHHTAAPGSALRGAPKASRRVVFVDVGESKGFFTRCFTINDEAVGMKVFMSYQTWKAESSEHQRLVFFEGLPFPA